METNRKQLVASHINRAGIPVYEVRSVPVNAIMWAGNYEYVNTITRIKNIKNR
jgi:hypothetical protein